MSTFCLQPGLDVPFYGTDRTDVIYGTAGNDIIFGGYGYEDYIYGGWGNDTIFLQNNLTLNGFGAYAFGGEGNDTIYVLNGLARARAGAGDDTIYTAGDNSYIYGEGGNDKLTILSGSKNIEGYSLDFADGGSGNDRIYYREGVENQVSEYAVMVGGTGADVFQLHFQYFSQEQSSVYIDFNRLEKDRLFISLNDQNGGFIARDSQVKDWLDTNNDHRIDTSDGYNATIDWGVTSDDSSNGGMVLHIGGGNEVTIYNTSSLDFFV